MRQRGSIRVVEGMLQRLRLKDSIVLGLTFQCPCGRTNRCKVSSIVGQNDTTVQFRCKGCKAIVNLPKKRDAIDKVLHANR